MLLPSLTSMLYVAISTIEVELSAIQQIHLLDLITPYKSFPSKMDLTCAFELLLFKTVVFKFKWKLFFNINDFIKLNKDLSLLLFIFEEPLPLWNSKKHIEKRGFRIKVPRLNLTSIRQWNKMKQLQTCNWTSHKVGANVFGKTCLRWISKNWREIANDLSYFS